MRHLAVVSFVLVSLLVSTARAAEGPWPAPVPGHVPPKPGEHPRLFFRRGDLPDLKARAKTPEGQALVARLRFLLDGANGRSLPVRFNDTAGNTDKTRTDLKDPAGQAYTLWHGAGYGMLWQLTGERIYADLAKESVERALTGTRDRDGRYAFRQPAGALRAGPSLGAIAVAYDLGYDGWDPDFRSKLAEALENYNEGKNRSLEELVRGSRHMPASNHWGMQVGGGALATLALMNDPGVDQDLIAKLLDQSKKAMIRNVTEGFGDHGWFAEGDGTGVMASFIIYLPAVQAWRVAGGLDFASPRPNVRWTALKFLMLTVPRDGQPDFPKRGAYPHNVWSPDGVSGAGLFCEGFGILNEVEKPGLLWLYNRLTPFLNPDGSSPFETRSEYPHRAVFSLINWPFGMEEDSPASRIPQAVRDETFGFYMMRRSWKDENDVVISCQPKSTRGWHKANSRGDVAVWALGKKENWGRTSGDVRFWKAAANGSAVVTTSDGTSLAVDFSGASGADAMLAMTGPGAGSGASVQVDGTTVQLKFIGGSPAQPEIQGETVVVGKQTISIEDGNLVLGVFGDPWTGPTASVPAASTSAASVDPAKVDLRTQNLMKRMDLAGRYLERGAKLQAMRIYHEIATHHGDTAQGREAAAKLAELRAE